MKILDLHIQGFRSLKEISWKLGDLNLIIGPNGSGKSNLLRALEMLSVSARGGLSKQVLREGGMESSSWEGIAPQIQFNLQTSGIDTERDSDRLYYELTLSKLGATNEYRIEHERLGHEKEEELSSRTILERTSSNAVVYNEQQQGFPAAPETVSQEETFLSQAVGPFTANRLAPSYREWLGSWGVYHDFQTHRDAPIRQPTIARNEHRIAADGSNFVQVLHTLYTSNHNFKQDLNLGMNAAFGNDFDGLAFPSDVDQRVQLKLAWKSSKRWQSTGDLSDGILRFLYLIAILADPTPPPLVAIDKPETGLHPSMLPILAEYARDASSRTQIILTTHSAELLDDFSEYEPSVTVAKWEDGQTRLEVLSNEHLRYWLEDYTLGKLYRSGELEEM